MKNEDKKTSRASQTRAKTKRKVVWTPPTRQLDSDTDGLGQKS